MLRLLGSRKTFCGGVSRRDLLHIGGAGAFAPPLCNALRAGDTDAQGAQRWGGQRSVQPGRYADRQRK